MPTHQSLSLGLALAALIAIPPSHAAAQAAELYQVDVAHAELAFKVRLVGFNRVAGTFEDYRGDMLVVGDDPLRSSFAMSIGVKSVRTGVGERDDHLRSDAFFDAARWPAITFISRTIEHTSDGFAAIGPLTIRDVSRDVRVPFTVVSSKAKDPFGNTRFSVAGRLVLNRRDFGVVGPAFWNRAISDSVEIEFEMPGRRWDYNTLGWGPKERISGGKTVMDAVLATGIKSATDDAWAAFAQHRADTTYNWSTAEYQRAAGRLSQMGKFREAAAVLELGIRVGDALDSKQGVSNLRVMLAELRLRDGDRVGAAELASAALRTDETNTAARLVAQFVGDVRPQGKTQNDALGRPSPRSGFGLAFDRQRSRIVLFGGSDTAYQRLADTWVWSGGRWTRLDGSGPDARADFAMTYDARRGVVVLFGGRTASGLAGDTWELGDSGWRRVDATGPPPRALTSMAYDEARGRVVLFGGSAGRAPLADTWEYDGRAWTQITSRASPPQRASHSMVYDAARRRIVVIAGYDSDALSDTWEWDGATWSRGKDGPDLLHTATAYDPGSKRVLIFGGFSGDGRTDKLWQLNADSWTTIPSVGPVARAEHRGAYVNGLGFVVFGGIGGQVMTVADRGKAKLNDLWAFDGKGWHRLDE